MRLTKEIIEQYNYKKINFSMWRKGDMTLQKKSYPQGETLVERIINPSQTGYRACYKGKYLTFIETEGDLQNIDRSYFTLCEDDAPDEVGEKVQIAKKLTLEKLDELFHSFGFLPPRNKKELMKFREFYKDYPFELSKRVINPEEVLNKLRAHKAKKITLDNFDEWFRSVGFLLPRTVKELRRFEELYKDFPHEPIKDISIEDAMAFFENDTKKENQ